MCEYENIAVHEVGTVGQGLLSMEPGLFRLPAPVKPLTWWTPADVGDSRGCFAFSQEIM